MTTLNVAVVSKDPSVRLAAARAFDQAPASWSVHLHDRAPREADVLVFGSDLEHEAGDRIVFDPGSDREVVEEVRRSVSVARCKMFAVLGAGRGTGVTSLALHLAAAAARDHPTCFVDLDLEWGAAGRLGIEADHLSWRDANDEEDALRMAALPVAGGFRALLAPSQESKAPQSSTDEDDVVRLVRRAGSLFDRVFIDCASPDSRDGVLDAADAGVLVVSATPVGARRAISILSRHQTTRWAIVLNRVGPGGETTRAELHRLLGRRSAIELPCTPALRDAEDEGLLLTTPWSRYVRGVARLLSALEAVS